MSIKTTIICDLCRSELTETGIHVPESLSEARQGSIRDVLVPKGDYHLSCLTEALKPKTAIDYVYKEDVHSSPSVEDDVAVKVISIIKDFLHKEEPVYVGKQLNHLDLDSIDHIEIVMAIENEFDIQLADDQLVHVKLVSDLIGLVKNAML